MAADGDLGANTAERPPRRTSTTGNTYTVTFDRDVSKCSFTASPVGGASPEAPGVETGPAANQARVDLDDTPAERRVVPPAGHLLGPEEARRRGRSVSGHGRGPAFSVKSAQNAGSSVRAGGDIGGVDGYDRRMPRSTVQVRRILRFGRLLAGLLVASSVGAGADSAAGRYKAYTCQRPDGSAAPIERWTAQATIGYAHICSSPRDYFHVALPIDPIAAFSYAALIWTPPAGVRPVALTLQRHFQTYASTTGGRLVVRLNNPSALPQAPDIREACDGSAGCTQREGTITIEGLDAGPIYLIAECRDGLCDDGDPLYGSSVDFVASKITFVLADDVPPSVTAVSGSLTGQGPHFGPEDITYRAIDDGSGVYRHRVRIDGAMAVDSVASSNDGRCRDPFPSNADPYEFDYAQPCAQHVDGRVTVDLGALGQGRHQVQLSVVDAAGNETVAYRGSVDVVSDPARRAIDSRGIAGLFNPLGTLPGLVLNGANGEPRLTMRTSSVRGFVAIVTWRATRSGGPRRIWRVFG